jgi:hypothetical protein
MRIAAFVLFLSIGIGQAQMIADRNADATVANPAYKTTHPRIAPVKVILQYRRLSARCLSATAMRTFAQSAFADEDDRAALVFGPFFNPGQRFCFHCRIFSSFRSTARPLGR